MNKIALNTLIIEVSNAVQETQKALNKVDIEDFMEYFDKQNDGKIVAHCKKLLLSYNECGEEKESLIYVPTVSLVPHNPIALEKVEVTVKSDMCSYEDRLMMELGSSMKPNDVSEQERYPCEIKLVFQNKEMPEGMKEALEMINKRI